jgi:hypothetical protein
MSVENSSKKSKMRGGRFAIGTKVAASNYAFEEYGLTPSEMNRAAKRIHAEIEAARSRGELTRFSGDIKTLKFSDAKKS